MAVDLKPIETVYKGYRFRSRLEARWAVFFDQMQIPWEYETQGFDLGDAGWYLPDFFLPTFNRADWFFDANGMWVEVKRENVSDDELRKVNEFRRRANHAVLVTDGDPLTTLNHDWYGNEFSEYPHWDIPLQKAMRVARQVRFEHGATVPTIDLPYKFIGSVYFAGKVSGPNGNWRSDIASNHASLVWHCAGPDIFLRKHSGDNPCVVDTFKQCWGKATTVFAWIDTDDARGTLFEIGLAKGHRKDVFIAFASDQLREAHWFIAEQAPHVVAPTPQQGWEWFLGYRLHKSTDGKW